MRVLLVTAVEQGSGETITALHIAETLTRQGNEVLFLASAFAQRFLESRFAGSIRSFGSGGAENVRLWEETLRTFRPDVVVFADYPLLFFQSGCAPLAEETGWIESLDELDACLVTLDHFGFAQGELELFMGPPHLGLNWQHFPAIPERMHRLLPCPMHEPGPVEGRLGEPIRYWQVPIEPSQEACRQVRLRYLESEDDLLVFHMVSNWGWQSADNLGLAFYRYLPWFLESYLGGLSRPVTVVSVNNGSLLTAWPGGRTRLVNLGPIPPQEFEALLFGSDLAITENGVSISLGKAICGLQPCASLMNSYRLPELMEFLEGELRDVVLAMEGERLGTVYPFHVYPTGMIEELETLILYRDNSLTAGFERLELFGGAETRDAFDRLLLDPEEREGLRRHQRTYVERLRRVSEASDVLAHLVEVERPAR